MRKKLSAQINRRLLVLAVMFALIMFIIISNTFRLQLVEGKTNLLLANNISRQSEIIRAPRGLIYDSNGQKLVQNEATFNVYVIPGELDQDSREEVFQRLADTFDADFELIKQRYEKSGLNVAGEPVGERTTLIYDIDYDDFLANTDTIDDLGGVYFSSESKRIYLDPKYFAHILGYIGDINAEEVDSSGLDVKAQVGKDGLEKVYDEKLRGEDGLKISERKPGDVDQKSWIPKSYNSGENLYLTVDAEWQHSLYSYLEKYSQQNGSLGSAAVVMEADTGAIKAMVNYPTYDLNLFAEGISQKDFDKLVKDDQLPLLNRSIAMQIPTGSIFKVFMASSLQQENIITKDTQYKSGCFELPGGYELCEADNKNYGTLNMTSALARSSNPYFCQASVAMAEKLGSDELAIRTLDDYFKQFGLGQTTGIDLPGEQPGTIPSPELKLRLQAEPWYLADLCNTAIGQGLVAATPVQVATGFSAIVNGGTVYKPHLVGETEDGNGDKVAVKPEKVDEVKVDQVYFDNILDGMSQAVDYGTATGLRGLPGNPRAKTGSSEATVRTLSGRIIEGAHSWVLGTFEYEGKDYVFVVAQQFGGRGYKSVPIAADFIDCLFKDFESCK